MSKRKRPISLEEFKDKFYERYGKESVKQKDTGIKCQKCSGVYKYVDFHTVLLSKPAQQQVICDACGDKQYIPVG